MCNLTRFWFYVLIFRFVPQCILFLLHCIKTICSIDGAGSLVFLTGCLPVWSIKDLFAVSLRSVKRRHRCNIGLINGHKYHRINIRKVHQKKEPPGKGNVSYIKLCFWCNISLWSCCYFGQYKAFTPMCRHLFLTFLFTMTWMNKNIQRDFQVVSLYWLMHC